MTLRRKLGLNAVLAVVVGDMIGSGIFFIPGELAAIAHAEWQVYFLWTLCGVIMLCGALTLAELSVLLPRAGVAYRALNEAFGPRAGFMLAWIMVLISGPGAIAGIAILFGDFADRVLGYGGAGQPKIWAIGAIVAFGLINLRGAMWGGRTQIFLTSIKVLGLLALIVGGLFLASPAETRSLDPRWTGAGTIGLIPLIGFGVALVLFTYDGWIDASNVAGEVKDPGRTFPLAMGLGVIAVIVIYLLVNMAFLSVMSLDQIRSAQRSVPSIVAEAAFGPHGGAAVTVLIWISILGALGGLVLTLPRLFYAAASEYAPKARGTRMAPFFDALAFTSEKTAVPTGAILFACGVSIVALLFFDTFAEIANFFVVPFQLITMLMVASIFRLRSRLSDGTQWRLPLYPLPPLMFIAVMAVLLITALLFNPVESLIGVALTLAGLPVYHLLTRDAP